MKGAFSKLFPQKTHRKKMKVGAAWRHLIEDESSKLVDEDKITDLARERVEQMGIVFIDEIDKLASGSQQRSADISREGVQRDLLPIVEGSAVNTKYGLVNTDHILFIAAGRVPIYPRLPTCSPSCRAVSRSVRNWRLSERKNFTAS